MFRRLSSGDLALYLSYLNVVSVPEPSELLLPGGVPDVEADGAAVGVEDERVHLHAQRRHVLLLELARQVPLHEGRLA